jgi:hypothetical protein
MERVGWGAVAAAYPAVAASVFASPTLDGAANGLRLRVMVIVENIAHQR